MTTVSRGQTVSGQYITAGNTLYVLGGGSALDIAVQGGGLILVSSGGVIISALLESPFIGEGTEFVIANVSSGGIAISTTVLSGADLEILDGGTATGTVILSGGEDGVSGVSYNESIMAGGTLIAEGLNIFTEAAGTASVLSGIIEGLGFIVQSGPGTLELVGSSSLFRGTDVIAGGTLELASVGTIDHGTIDFLGDTGTLRIDGAVALTNPISGMISGTAVDIAGLPYAPGGSVTVSSNSVTITEGGSHQTLTIVGASFDGAFTLAPDAGGGTVLTNDAVVPLITAGETFTISAGQTSRGVEVFAGGTLTVLSGGVAIATADLGQENLNGGTESGGFVSSGGVQTVGSGALAAGETVISGGGQIVSAGGSAASATLGDGATQMVMSGGTAVNDTVLFNGTVVNAGVLAFTEASGDTNAMLGALSGTGSLVQSGPGTLVFGGAADSFTGAMIISGGTLELASYAAPGSATVEFAGAAGTLQIDGAGAPTNPISGLVPGDVIDLVGLAYNTFGRVTASGDTVTIAEDGITVPLTIASAESPNYYLTPDNTSGTDLKVACYCPGAAIRTVSGEIAVERLAIGDRVVTLDGHHEAIRWIGRRRYAGRFIAGNHLMLPVTIKAGALAPRMPYADLTLSPGHAIWVDSQLVPVWRLVNGVSITQAPAVAEATYLHVELGRHALLLANGLPAESFLDEQGFRGQFQNASEFHALYRDAAPLTPLQLKLEDGFALQAIQERLAARAGIAPQIEPAGLLRGYIDQAGPRRVSGWAQDVDSPEEPVALELLVGGVPMLCVLANAYRADLRHAGIGSGCHAFDLALPDGFFGSVIARRVTDGAVLGQTNAAHQMERVALRVRGESAPIIAAPAGTAPASSPSPVETAPGHSAAPHRAGKRARRSPRATHTARPRSPAAHE